MTIIVDNTDPAHCLYPFQELTVEDGYPVSSKFDVIRTKDGRGEGIVSLRHFRRGHMLSRVSGYLISSRRLHTLQINERTHLYDPYFSGLLLHSCDPNVFLDMAELELWALRDIVIGEILTMDYASTEDILMRQFACRCGAPNCRGWITGSKELPNRAGQIFLERFLSRAVA